ncbi:hypothetical protein L9F63_022369, partial [Diploptera punctata]
YHKLPSRFLTESMLSTFFIVRDANSELQIHMLVTYQIYIFMQFCIIPLQELPVPVGKLGSENGQVRKVASKTKWCNNMYTLQNIPYVYFISTYKKNSFEKYFQLRDNLPTF